MISYMIRTEMEYCSKPSQKPQLGLRGLSGCKTEEKVDQDPITSQMLPGMTRNIHVVEVSCIVNGHFDEHVGESSDDRQSLRHIHTFFLIASVTRYLLMLLSVLRRMNTCMKHRGNQVESCPAEGIIYSPYRPTRNICQLLPGQESQPRKRN